MRTALEQEREYILEQIHANREIYRNLLRSPSKQNAVTNFPRSRTFQWIKDHRLISIAAGALIALAFSARFRKKRRTQYQATSNYVTFTPLKALLAISAVILQNPARLRAALRIAGDIRRSLQK